MTLWEAGDPAVEGGTSSTTGPDGREAPDPLAGADRTWSLPELGRAVQRALATAAPRDVWVRGEIRNFRAATAAGHRYFQLVAPGASPDARLLASFRAKLLKRDAIRVNARLAAAGNAARLADGVEVRVRVRLEWWTSGGQLDLLVTDIDPTFTLGQLEAQRAAVLAALQREGLLRRNHALAVSPLPLRVGLVTSRGSAAHADFLHELAASAYRFRVHLADARMQGPSSPGAVSRAIASFASGSVDVVVLVRGGGARTDLAAFDGEPVARAVATCPVPVFCGIGHETDRTVVDEAAHTSRKTPTACAAALVEHVAAAELRAETLWEATARDAVRHLDRAQHGLSMSSARLGNCGRRATEHAEAHAHGAARRLLAAASEVPLRAGARLARRTGRAEGAARRHLNIFDERLARTTARLALCAPARVRAEETRLASAAARLQALDPARILARGWSITRTAEGGVVREIASLGPGDQLVTTLHRGSVTSTVAAVVPHASSGTSEEAAHDGR